MTRCRAVAIGGSAGGILAVSSILSALPVDFSLSLFVVLHRDPRSDGALVKTLSQRASVALKEVDDKESILPGTIYLAPSNYHLLVEKDFSLSLSCDEKVKFARPSIDICFETAAEAYGPALTAVLLTGASDDGADGLRVVKALGGLTVVQDPATAESRTMPEAAIGRSAPDFILPLARIGPFLRDVSRQA